MPRSALRRAPGRCERRAVTRHVLVVGGGWAGCAAALRCADAGLRVSLREAAPVLGGRARTVMRGGLALDNGQHLMLGAYSATRRLVAHLHPSRPALAQAPLELAALDPARPDAMHLRARAWPAPLGLAAALAGARGFSWRERIGALRAAAAWKRARFACPPGASVADVLAAVPRAVAERLWTPLCLAALNTPPARASGQVFLNVLQAAFDGRADDALAVLPTMDLGAVLPAAAQGALTRAGHTVATASKVRLPAFDDDGVEALIDGQRRRYDAAIVAVGPHQVAGVFEDAAACDRGVQRALAIVAKLEYEPITTVYLGYRDAEFALPPGLLRLDDDPAQWLFDRGDILAAGTPDVAMDRLLAGVISASGAHDAWPQEQLVAAVHAQLARALPRLPLPVWSQVIAERRATYACTPGLAHPPVVLAPRLFLAGDYVYPRFPATLEAAVRSGEAAADLAIGALPPRGTR